MLAHELVRGSGKVSATHASMYGEPPDLSLQFSITWNSRFLIAWAPVFVFSTVTVRV